MWQRAMRGRKRRTNNIRTNKVRASQGGWCNIYHMTTPTRREGLIKLPELEERIEPPTKAILQPQFTFPPLPQIGNKSASSPGGDSGLYTPTPPPSPSSSVSSPTSGSIPEFQPSPAPSSKLEHATAEFGAKLKKYGEIFEALGKTANLSPELSAVVAKLKTTMTDLSTAGSEPAAIGQHYKEFLDTMLHLQLLILQAPLDTKKALEQSFKDTPGNAVSDLDMLYSQAAAQLCDCAKAIFKHAQKEQPTPSLDSRLKDYNRTIPPLSDLIASVDRLNVKEKPKITPQLNALLAAMRTPEKPHLLQQATLELCKALMRLPKGKDSFCGVFTGSQGKPMPAEADILKNLESVLLSHERFLALTKTATPPTVEAMLKHTEQYVSQVIIQQLRDMV